MEKLIELLNEYEISKSHRDYEWKIEKKTKERMCGVEYTGAYVDDEEMERIVISKKYRFIQRLVENDKIDFDNRELKDKFMEEFERYPTFNSNTYKRDFNENGLLMLLAISDTPIEDLISYLNL